MKTAGQYRNEWPEIFAPDAYNELSAFWSKQHAPIGLEVANHQTRLAFAIDPRSTNTLTSVKLWLKHGSGKRYGTRKQG